ncbi:hypothetical protein [uncultured Alteromonas sp.]|jgi:hypothetical protein|uniref:hypothetical protein n=1 Tax=uncultured Alteromonas sp. TaxID=179113 RepID=UPI0030D38D93|tara:strand:+ start:11005 stop:11724 length:720 start_codon:yes stop_codon:yes gene_type:complete
MKLKEMIALAESLVETGVLVKTMNSVTMGLNIMGYSNTEVFKRSASLAPIPFYAPSDEQGKGVVDFCGQLNAMIAHKAAAEELLISFPHHLMYGNDIEAKLDVSRRYQHIIETLSFMDKKSVYESLGTKDSNQARAIGRLVKAGKLIELKVGALTDPIYPTFQFDENVVLYPGIEHVITLLTEHGKTVLEFCELIQDEATFMDCVKKTSIKNKKQPFTVFQSYDSVEQLFEQWLSDSLF